MEREKGELMRKLLSTNTLRLNLTEVATPSSNFGENFGKKIQQQDNTDSEQTIFQLTEKVILVNGKSFKICWRSIIL